MRSISRNTLGPHRANRKRLAGWLLTLGSAGLVALLTLMPEPIRTGPSRDGFWCLRCGDFGSVDALLNMALFVPLGTGIGLLSATRRRTLLLAIAISAGVEFLQLTVVPGRDPSLSDIAMNGGGGLVGWLFAGNWRRLAIPDARLAVRLATGFAMAWIGGRTAAGFLLQPSLPETRWFAQLGPRGVYPADFQGLVGRAEGNGHHLPRGEITAALRAKVDTPPWRVSVRLLTGDTTPALASVLSVLTADRREVFLVGQQGAAARFRLRLRAADAKFRVPSVRLANGLRQARGTPVHLEGELRGGSLTITETTKAGTTSQSLSLTPGLGWALLLPVDHALSEGAALVTGITTLLCVLILAYWCGVARPRSGPAEWSGSAVAALQVVLVVVTGLLLPSIATATSPPHYSEWCAAAVGAVVGLVTGRRASTLIHERARTGGLTPMRPTLPARP